MTLVVGVDQGIREPLDAEPVIARARERLEAAGLVSSGEDGLWIVTHVVRGEQPAHTAIGLVIPTTERPVDEVLGLVEAAFSPDEADDEHLSDEHDGHTHSHEPLAAPSVWAEGLSVGSADWQVGARWAAEATAAGDIGRAVVFPGVDELRGEVPVETVGEVSAVQVRSMGGEVAPGTMLVTRNHVRPVREQGRWVLLVQPALGGTLVPFEAPEQHDCCSQPPLADEPFADVAGDPVVV